MLWKISLSICYATYSPSIGHNSDHYILQKEFLVTYLQLLSDFGVQHRNLDTRKSLKPLPNTCGAAVGYRVVIYSVISITSLQIFFIRVSCNTTSSIQILTFIFVLFDEYCQPQVFKYWLLFSSSSMNTVTRDFFICVLCYRCSIEPQVFKYWHLFASFSVIVTRDFFICVLCYRCSIEPQVFKYWFLFASSSINTATRDFFICVLCYRCSIQPQVFKYCEICPQYLNIHEIFF